jgi:hypothetical protein
MPAVTSVTNFSDGNVLTATALNAVNCGIHVYSNAAARDAAYGGSGERTLVEGEYAYLLDTDQTLVYSGSSWITVGVTPGLVCVKAETSFSAAAAVNVDNVFTSSYTHYFCLFSAASSATNEIGLYIRLRAASTDTSTGYYFGVIGATQAAGTATGGGSNSTLFQLGDFGGVLSVMPITFGSPQVAARTSIYWQGQEAATNTSVNRGIQVLGGFLDNATQYDGFTVYPSSGTITGSYTVYGYSKTV